MDEGEKQRREKNEKAKERMKRYRQKKSAEAKLKTKEENKERMTQKRSRMTDLEKSEELKRRRQNYAKKKEARKEKEQGKRKLRKNEQDKKRMKKIRKEKTAAERELESVEQLIRRRKVRAERTEEELKIDREKAKAGMKELKTMTRIVPFRNRIYMKMTEMQIWKTFRRLGPSYREILQEKRPEILKKIEDEESNKRKEKVEKEEKLPWKKAMEEQEKAAIEEAKKAGRWGSGENEGYVWMDTSFGKDWYWAGEGEEPKSGEWVIRDGDYHWEGEGDPPEDCADQNNWEITEEDKKRFKEQEEAWLLDEMERQKEEKKDYMRKYHQKKKAEGQVPIEMPPDSGPKSDYLLLQEKNIKELEEMKKKSGLFDD